MLYAISSSDCIASRRWMIVIAERTRLWLVVRYYFLICEGTGENHVKLAKIAGVLAVIRTDYLPNTNQYKPA